MNTGLTKKDLLYWALAALFGASIGILAARTLLTHEYAIDINPALEGKMSSHRELIQADALQCEWGETTAGLFSSNVFSPLIYYSHLFPAFAMAVLGFVVWRQKKNTLLNSLFIFITTTFVLWCLFDLVTWAESNIDRVMFFWSAEIYLDPLIYFGSAYLFYVFVWDRDVTLSTKIGSLLLYIPILLLAPTPLNLQAFNYTNCDREAVEGVLWHYTYFVELIATMWLLVQGLRAFQSRELVHKKIQVALFGLGLLLFMLAFSWGNLVGTITENWAIAQYGLFGMPFFLATVMYLIVRYKAFDVKAIATTALVISLCVMLGSTLLLPTVEVARPVIALTLLLAVVMGYLLVRSVHVEVVQRQEVERLSDEKSEFMAFASHEIRNPITAMRGYASLITDGTTGEINQDTKKAAEQILLTGNEVLMLIRQFLDRSKLELGKVSYSIEPFDISLAITQVADGFKAHIAERGLALHTEIQPGIMVKGDLGKFKEVLGNVVDNSLKYTREGSITLTTELHEKGVRAVVIDTGVGIPPETLPHLFQKFSRADAQKANLLGTGLGLYLGKVFVEGMGGKIWAESDGKGKGSRFIIELPKV